MWIDVRVRRPTESDSDAFGNVVWRHRDGSTDVDIWNADSSIIGGVAWQPIEPYKPLPEIPAGYRLLGREEYNQQQHPEAMFLSNDGSCWKSRYVTEDGRYYHSPDTYIVPVEKKYRPFRDGEEFRPHRERWWRVKRCPHYMHPPQSYGAERYGQGERSWQAAFTELEFDDGSPFGVEVTE